jgi:putative methyltransferase (TIGR04325 family)
MTLRQLLNLIVPPIFPLGYQAMQGVGKQPPPCTREEATEEILRLSGDYATWSDALSESTGYNADVILQMTTEALHKVKQGEAVYERDTVLFNEVQYTWPLLAGLMWVAARCNGCLNVLDFGGSLGSTYFQNRTFLKGLNGVRWNIVEQARHVEVGKQAFQDEYLKFYETTNTCLAETKPRVLVLSGVLQYLENPHKVLIELLSTSCDHLIIDRTPFWEGATDRLCVQHVPSRIYPASYPCWVFSIDRFRAALNREWEIIAEFESLDNFPSPVETKWKGLCAIRRGKAS